MSFEFLFKLVDGIDDQLTGLFSGAPLLVALAIAFALGLRHASARGGAPAMPLCCWRSACR
jgi:hypothetical protein